MSDKDALAAHLRDELAITETNAANPLQAAAASAVSFTSGGAIPLLAAWLLPLTWLVPGVVAISLAALAVLGFLGARGGGAPATRSVVRVVFWGALAMAVTMGVGKLFGTAVG